MTHPEQYPPNPLKLPATSPMSKTDPKHTNITLCERPHESHGLKQGNLCPNTKKHSQTSPAKTNHPLKDHPTPPILPSTYPISKPEPKPTNITLLESPHRSHGLKQGNHCPISKTNSQSFPNNMTHSQKEPLKPPNLPMISPMSKPDPKSPKITLCKIPHGIHGPKQGNP